MRRFLENKLTLTGALILFTLAFALNSAQGSQLSQLAGKQAGGRVTHGPTMPPDPNDPPRIAGHGPTMPPDPNDPPSLVRA